MMSLILAELAACEIPWGKTTDRVSQHIDAARDTGVAVMKSAYVVAAVLVAGGIVALASLSQVQASAPVLGGKGDRVDARPLGATCSAHKWPYFEATCPRDPKQPFGQARQVRIVSTDQLPQ
jgi:hypothetical protein